MAFIKKVAGTYKWPVVAEIPVDGTFEKQSFEAIFKRLKRSQFQKLADQGDVELLNEVLEGWENVVGEDGKDLPFTNANRKELTDDPYFVKAVLRAYLESLEGGQAKN